jgi:acyl-CoA synthetase (AMP-forming)/AMP-acid ligase II
MPLHEIYREALRHTPHKPAVVVGTQALTYRELDDLSHLWARAMLSLGIRKGDRVSILMPNRVEYLPLYFACYRIGAIASPLSCLRQTVADEVVFALNLTRAKMLILDAKYRTGLEGIAHRIPSLEWQFVMDERAGEESWPRFARSACPAAAASADVHWPRVEEGDPALIIFTSGSTSRPKGVTHTHSSIRHTAVNKSETLRLGSSDVHLIGTMLCHASGGFGFSMPTLYKGGTVVLPESFTPAALLDLLERHRATHVAVAPLHVEEMLALQRTRGADLTSIRTFRCGSDAVSLDLLERFRAATGFELLQTYGSTECEECCMNPPYGENRRGSIGRPIHGTRMKLLGPDGRDAPPGETGEMAIQSEAVMTGYWEDPEHTAETLVDGWLRTGDLARQDEYGYCFFAGRIKGIIVKGGTNITPAEVEDVVAAHPAVMACGVVGEPDARLGQTLHAFVLPDTGRRDNPPTVEELTAFASTKLSAIKVPDRWTFVEALPLTEVGKIDRKGLAALAEQ